MGYDRLRGGVLHRRLRGLPSHEIAPNAVVLVAAGFRSRLLGLSLLRPHDLPEGHGLLLPACSSIQTLGMRFPIDVAFADGDGTILRVIRDVRSRRILNCPGAEVALEAHAGELSRFLEGGRGAGARLSPRIPLDARA